MDAYPVEGTAKQVDVELNELHNSLAELKGKVTALISKVADLEQHGTGLTGVKPFWSDIVTKSDMLDNKLAAVATDVQSLQKTTTEIQQDRVELEEQSKRKNCIIVQGLTEAGGNSIEDRKQY